MAHNRLDISHFAGQWPYRVGGIGTSMPPMNTSLRIPTPVAWSLVAVVALAFVSWLPDGAGQLSGTSVPVTWQRVAQLTFEGIKFGLIIGVTAIGLSLVFGISGLVNFAHGELVTIGATVAFLLNASAAGPLLPLPVAAAIAVAAGALVGVGLERGLWQPMRRRGATLTQLFIMSVGLSLLLRHATLIAYGGSRQSYRGYAIQQPLALGPVSATPRDLTVMGISLLVLAAVGLFLTRSHVGRATRAISGNAELAAVAGINVTAILRWTWLVAGVLAAIGGVMFGLVEAVSWDMGFNLLLLMFAGVILGGLGTAFGALMGSLVVGLVAQLSTLVLPVELRNAWALSVMVLVLALRPQGLFGRRERVA